MSVYLELTVRAHLHAPDMCTYISHFYTRCGCRWSDPNHKEHVGECLWWWEACIIFLIKELSAEAQRQNSSQGKVTCNDDPSRWIWKAFFPTFSAVINSRTHLFENVLTAFLKNQVSIILHPIYNPIWIPCSDSSLCERFRLDCNEMQFSMLVCTYERDI